MFSLQEAERRYSSLETVKGNCRKASNKQFSLLTWNRSKNKFKLIVVSKTQVRPQEIVSSGGSPWEQTT